MTLLRAGRTDVVAPVPPHVPRRRTWRAAVRRDWQLYSLAVLPLLFFAVFRYLPMLGNVIAFRRYSPGGDVFGEYWVGLRYFKMFLADPTFCNAGSNTHQLDGFRVPPAVVFPRRHR
jgi:putative aldouronate transport system permease protein